MDLTDYQQSLLVWLYGLQNYQGIFANVPPPPPGIIPPPISQAPDGEAWIAAATVAAGLPAQPEVFPEIPGTAQNDPQAAIAAMPSLVAQEGGALYLTLIGAKTVEGWGDLPQWWELAEEAAANIKARRDILDEAASRTAGNPLPASSETGADAPRRATNTALLAREGLIAQNADLEWILTEKGAYALQGAGDLLPAGAA